MRPLAAPCDSMPFKVAPCAPLRLHATPCRLKWLHVPPCGSMRLDATPCRLKWLHAPLCGFMQLTLALAHTFFFSGSFLIRNCCLTNNDLQESAETMPTCVNPLVPSRHICAAYIGHFVENSILKISQFSFFFGGGDCLYVYIGLNFRKVGVIFYSLASKL
jgi:hypothetical protein